MKNIGHPNMFPDIAAAAAPIEVQAITDADVGGIANASTSASPWANPLSTLKQSAPAAAAPRPEKSTSRTEQVIAYLREHGPSASGDICEALGMNLDAGVAPYVVAALKNGRIIRLGRKYALPCHVGEQLAAAPASVSVSTPMENPAAKRGRPRSAGGRAGSRSRKPKVRIHRSANCRGRRRQMHTRCRHRRNEHRISRFSPAHSRSFRGLTVQSRFDPRTTPSKWRLHMRACCRCCSNCGNRFFSGLASGSYPGTARLGERLAQRSAF